MKKKIVSIIFTFIFSITIFNPSTSVKATDENQNNINMIVLFNDNKIDNNVEEFITKSGGEIVKEISELGGIEVTCSPNIIKKVKSQESVESISPIRIIKIEENKSMNSKSYYNNNDNGYYYEKENSYYESNNDSYYEDKGNNYYEDKGKSYYEEKENSYYEEDIKEDLYDMYQWDIKRVTNNGESFKIESGNHDVIIGIVDSGVDTEHSDLKDNFLGGSNFVPKDFDGNNTEYGDINDIEDRFGHGTEVTGQIAANGRIKGVAPGIGFKSYRVFDEYGQTTASICADAIRAAVNDKVNIINLSISSYYLDGECTWTDENTGKVYNLGDDMADYSLLKRAIEYAIDNNVMVITSAGNDGIDCSDSEKLAEYFNDIYSEQGFSYAGRMYEEPGSFDGVINVSATNKNDKLASYSNYGQGFIDITAPGGDSEEQDDFNNMCITTAMGNKYEFCMGTSISAPKVAGAIALLLCKYNNMTSNDITEKLYSNTKVLGESQYYGNGMLDIYNLIAY